MDFATADFYRRYAATLGTSPEAGRSAMLAHAEAALAPGASVLDVGAGSGRDVAGLVRGGFDAFGVEPSADMLALARRAHPALASRLHQASLPRLGRPFSDCRPAGFDAVVCSAVLMHLAPAELPEALESMADQLRTPADGEAGAPSPAMLVSLPRMDPSRLAGHRDADGRRFHNHDPEQVCAILRSRGLWLERRVDSDAVLAATGTLWRTLVFRRAVR